MSEAFHSYSKRSGARKAHCNFALPLHCLESLEQKRKQLDDSIHKYIASKEREYKLFERDVKLQYEREQGQEVNNDGLNKRDLAQVLGDGSNSEPNRPHASTSTTQPLDSVSWPGVDEKAREGDHAQSSPQDRNTIAKNEVGRVESHRNRDLTGLFTPPGFSVLDGAGQRTLERTSSAPSISSDNAAVNRGIIPCERAHSDTVVQAQSSRPANEGFKQRTSSSGSLGEGKLASAMKTPAQPARRKRVSLAVGDSIFAPSDSVPVTQVLHNRPSHSRLRSPGPRRDILVDGRDEGRVPKIADHSVEASLARAESIALANLEDYSDLHSQNPLTEAMSLEALQTEKPTAKSTAVPSKIDPDGDLFDFEEDSYDSHLFLENEDLDDKLEDDEYEEADLQHYDSRTGIFIADTNETVYDSEAGIIHEQADVADASTSFPSTSLALPDASKQPTTPGFRRPSVIHDPVYSRADYDVVEREAVQNEIYGSSANRPSSKGSFTVGSLGQTYMAQHAEMMRSQNAQRRTQAQIRS